MLHADGSIGLLSLGGEQLQLHSFPERLTGSTGLGHGTIGMTFVVFSQAARNSASAISSPVRSTPWAWRSLRTVTQPAAGLDQVRADEDLLPGLDVLEDQLQRLHVLRRPVAVLKTGQAGRSPPA